MAKRFIDTEIFNDTQFSNLSIEGKLLFIYFITNCDHAGILKINEKLIKFQTGIENPLTIMKEFGNSLVTVTEEYKWMPKYLKFQYPDFPKSAVKQQLGALKILNSFGINLEKINSYLTVSKELPKYYDNVNDNVNEFKDNSILKTTEFLKIDEKVENELLTYSTWHEICLKTFTQLNQNELIKYIKQFIFEMKSREEVWPSYQAIKRHFVKWTQKEISKNPQKSPTRGTFNLK